MIGLTDHVDQVWVWSGFRRLDRSQHEFNLLAAAQRLGVDFNRRRWCALPTVKTCASCVSACEVLGWSISWPSSGSVASNGAQDDLSDL